MSEEPRRPFDRQHAASYDQDFIKLAPFKDALHILTLCGLAGVPENARILCVGAGTGAELVYLAGHFPGWRFMALDLSEPMLDVCRARVRERGLEARTDFHLGPVSSLPASPAYDGATCLLVSQFLMDPEDRRGLFRDIHTRLHHQAPMVTADLSCEADTPAGVALMDVWRQALTFMDRSPEQVEAAISAFNKHVSVLSESTIVDLMEAAGFDRPARIFQAGLMHGWLARA